MSLEACPEDLIVAHAKADWPYAVSDCLRLAFIPGDRARSNRLLRVVSYQRQLGIGGH
jgi:hypothetical protein